MLSHLVSAAEVKIAILVGFHVALLTGKGSGVLSEGGRKGYTRYEGWVGLRRIPRHARVFSKAL